MGNIECNAYGLLLNATSGNGIYLNSDIISIYSPTFLIESPGGIFLSLGTSLNFTLGAQIRPYSETDYNALTALINRVQIDSFRANDWSPYGRPGIQPFLNSTNYTDTLTFNILNQSEFIDSGLIYNGTWNGGPRRILFKYCVNFACNASSVLKCRSRFRLKHNDFLEGLNVFQGIQYNSATTLINTIHYECSHIYNVVNGDIIYLETNFNMTMQASPSVFNNWYSLHISEL
jgi:hypothetical protein